MSIIASFAVPHPPLIVREVGRGSEKQVQKTIDSYEKIAREIAVFSKIQGQENKKEDIINTHSKVENH